jgi:thymidylate synthase (FAD)
MITAEYISHMGDDLTIVNSARVSFNKESGLDEDGNVKPGDIRLITYLAEHDHFTPFTHAQITLRETVPIFVARQRFKHQIGFTYNEVSRRYVDEPPEVYFPDEWRGRPDGSIKQGSGDVIQHDMYGHDIYEKAIHFAVETYKELLNIGVCPEQARMVLPQSMFTSYYVTGSLAAFARAYKQRTAEHAQKEIKGLAKQWDEILSKLFPYSWASLINN